jgi:hypothetical protein
VSLIADLLEQLIMAHGGRKRPRFRCRHQLQKLSVSDGSHRSGDADQCGVLNTALHDSHRAALSQMMQLKHVSH